MHDSYVSFFFDEIPVDFSEIVSFALQTGCNPFRRTATDDVIIQMKTDLINGRVLIEKLGQRNRNNPVSFCPKHTG